MFPPVADNPFPNELENVIGRPRIAAPLESVALTVSVAVCPNGTDVAPEMDNFDPMMGTTNWPVAVPDVTWMVALRLALLPPAAKVAVATPAEFVVEDALDKVPEVVEKATGAADSPTFEAFFTTAVIVTVSPPVPTEVELDSTSTVAAVVVAPPESLAGADV